eukprot:4966979-Pleurochrysis_carterae.AAC.3
MALRQGLTPPELWAHASLLSDNRARQCAQKPMIAPQTDRADLKASALIIAGKTAAANIRSGAGVLTEECPTAACDLPNNLFQLASRKLAPAFASSELASQLQNGAAAFASRLEPYQLVCWPK